MAAIPLPSEPVLPMGNVLEIPPCFQTDVKLLQTSQYLLCTDISSVGKQHIAVMENNLNSSMPLTAGGFLPEGPCLADRLVGQHSPVLGFQGRAHSCWLGLNQTEPWLYGCVAVWL